MCARTGETICVTDTLADARYEPQVDGADAKSRTLLVVPVMSAGGADRPARVVAMLQAASKRQLDVEPYRQVGTPRFPT